MELVWPPNGRPLSPRGVDGVKTRSAVRLFGPDGSDDEDKKLSVGKLTPRAVKSAAARAAKLAEGMVVFSSDEEGGSGATSVVKSTPSAVLRVSHAGEDNFVASAVEMDAVVAVGASSAAASITVVSDVTSGEAVLPEGRQQDPRGGRSWLCWRWW